MKRKAIFYVIPIVTALILAVAVIFIMRYRKSGSPAILAEENITVAPLPVDKKAAQRELARVQKDLKKSAPAGKYIVIDTHANVLSYRTADTVLFKANCSTGSGGELIDSTTGRRWIFNTPRGVFKIKSKIAEPWWRKPDWAYIEDSLKPPDKESERYDPEMMGDYAMGFGSGYFIHGTIYERLIGVSVTHGCVRLGAEDLKYLYGKVTIGTPVYIF